MVTGEQGLPSDRLIWWLGDEPLMTIDGGKKAQVSFSLNSSEMNAIRLAKLSDENTERPSSSTPCTACRCPPSRPSRS